MYFNVHKCHGLKIGKGEMRPTWKCKMGQDITSRETEGRDLGVIIHNN